MHTDVRLFDLESQSNRGQVGVPSHPVHVRLQDAPFLYPVPVSIFCGGKIQLRKQVRYDRIGKESQIERWIRQRLDHTDDIIVVAMSI